MTIVSLNLMGCKTFAVSKLPIAHNIKFIHWEDYNILGNKLQIVKKSVKLPALSYHLLQECGLLSFLSSVLSLYGEGISSDNRRSAVMELVLEVISNQCSWFGSANCQILKYIFFAFCWPCFCFFIG